MKIKRFHTFYEFAEFLSENKEVFKPSPIKGFIDAVNKIRSTSCGVCKKRNIDIALSTYKNLLDVLSDLDKENIKNLLEVDEVIFYYNNNPMFKL